MLGRIRWRVGVEEPLLVHEFFYLETAMYRQVVHNYQDIVVEVFPSQAFEEQFEFNLCHGMPKYFKVVQTVLS